jgi:hypothetical protein
MASRTNSIQAVKNLSELPPTLPGRKIITGFRDCAKLSAVLSKHAEIQRHHVIFFKKPFVRVVVRRSEFRGLGPRCSGGRAVFSFRPRDRQAGWPIAGQL